METDKLKEQNVNLHLLETICKEINFDELLNKYGPNGLYLIANKLKEIADNDLKEALNNDN